MSNSVYDLIVVGAGTAGCVLAERLSQSGQFKILLIEAGGHPKNPFVKIPAGFVRLFKSELDWDFESEPQAAAQGRRIYIPRGKMLGGSSNMNAQIHQWCHPMDFEEWVAAGATGWGWTDVFPIFRAQERWLGEGKKESRGLDGPMRISPNSNAHRLSRAFVTAARAAGFGAQAEYNGTAYEGAWLCQLAHSNGQRFSAYDAYLAPAMRPANLQIITKAQVTRLNFDKGRVKGVTVRHNNKEETLFARGVILAAGAFGSPQILMLSGIGPKAALTQLGIKVVCDAPEVGENLQDHPLSQVVFRTKRADTLKNAESFQNFLRYLLFKRGMLASNAVEAFAFKRVHPSAPQAPDLELLFGPMEWRNEGLAAPEIHAFTIATITAAPRSRGRISLRSADPLAPPAIDFNLLSDPDQVDAAVLLAGARLARKIANTDPLREEKIEEVFPGENIESDDALLGSLKKELQTVYHPTSTCRMGSDARAVVDPKLRVAGITNLWVADASVMPSVPRGHPNAVVAMIAYRAAEMIKHDLNA